MSNNVMYTGVESILAGYELIKNPVFSIWKGRDLLFSNNDNDAEQGRVVLQENLEAWATGGNSDMLKICFHPGVQDKYITNKSPVTATLYVRCNPVVPTNYYVPSNTPGSFMSGAKDDLLLKRINELESRLAAYEDAEEGEEVNGIGKFESVINGVNTLLGNPLIAGLVSSLLKSMSTVKTNEEIPKLHKVAGINEEEYESALLYLKQVDADFDSDIILLAKLAKEKRSQFNWLIQMLRKIE